jgi:adenosylcobinamide-phosphate synthase
LAALGPLAAAALVGALVSLAGTISIPLGVGAATLILFVTTSRRMLLERTRSVVRASNVDQGGDIDRARADLPALVGRDVTDLTPGQIRSAAVESAAENLADGLVAPLLGFAVGAVVGGAVGPATALGLAAGAATWIKAVNTLDSMVGYPDRPLGWASARLDDVAMWVPARVTAVLIALVAGRPWALANARCWLPAVASPNAGGPMGALAAAGDCRLEKPGAYVLNPTASLPSVETALAGIRTVNRAALAAYGLTTLVAALEVLAWS